MMENHDLLICWLALQVKRSWIRPNTTLLAALPRLLLLPLNGSDERQAPENPLDGTLLFLRPVVLRHVAIVVRRYSTDQRLRGLKGRSWVGLVELCPEVQRKIS